MAKRKTITGPSYSRTIHPAAGLYYPVCQQTLLFDEMVDRRGRPRQVVSIGRDPRADIRVRNEYVSWIHAKLERSRDGSMVFVPLHSSNGTYVDGRLTTEPFVVALGMRIRLGHEAVLFSTDARGRVLIAAESAERVLVHFDHD